MKQRLHIKRALLKGYAPSKEHIFDPLNEACIICGKGRLTLEDNPVECFPRFGGEEKPGK